MSKSISITEEIAQRIQSNIYNEKIPGQRILADEFNVNVKTINRAIGQLVETGTLHRVRGKGTYVTKEQENRIFEIAICFFKHTKPETDPVFTQFFFGANAAAKKYNIRLKFLSLDAISNHESNSKSKNMTLFKVAIAQSEPDGVIFIGNIDLEMIKILHGHPLIVVGQTPPELNIDSVRRDIAGGTAAAVRHLHQSGHKNIGLASLEYQDSSYDIKEKELGYLQAIKELQLEQHIFRLPPAKLVEQLKKNQNQVSSIVATESHIGLRIMQHAAQQQIHVPNDLAVISFDDGNFGAFLNPSMSSIHAYGGELADKALQRIVDRITGQIKQRIRDCLPCPFFARDSSQSASSCWH